MDNLEKLIGEKLRTLRLARRLPQRQLAAALAVSQATVSRIEAGKEAISIRQLIAICRLFNVLPTDFIPEEGSAKTQIRRSLIRHGARNLVDDERTLPSKRLAEAKEALKETLIAAESPRDIAALAPVIVQNAATLPLVGVSSDLNRLGAHLERRLCWLLENVIAALDEELKTPLPQIWKVRYLRAKTRIAGNFNIIKQRWNPIYGQKPPADEDLVDTDLVGSAAINQARTQSSEISKRWDIISNLQVDDFVRAIRESRR